MVNRRLTETVLLLLWAFQTVVAAAVTKRTPSQSSLGVLPPPGGPLGRAALPEVSSAFPLSIRELVVEPRTTPRSSSHSEHNAHVSDLPRRLLSCACAARSVSCSPNAHRCTTAVGRPKARAWCSLGLWQCSWGLRVCTWRAAHLPHCTSCLICSWKRAMSRAR